MKLQHTDELLRALKASGDVESWAVIVGDHARRGELYSENVNGDTLFDAASMPKVLITSTLILHAADQGLMSLDDTLDKYFSFTPEEKRKITVRQLLTHTSGICRYVIPQAIADIGKEEVARYIINRSLVAPPGAEYRYSCTGYVLLGFIVEQVFGMTLDQAFEKYIKAPLGLTRSAFAIPVDASNAVNCISRAAFGKYRVDDYIVYALKGVAGNGGSFWSASDIERWVKAVMRKDSSLYSEKMYEAAEKDLTPHLLEGRGLGYLVVDGRYPQTGDLFAPGSFGHCGHTGASFFLDRRVERYVIILTNATRCQNLKSDYRTDNYSFVCDMRRRLHNAIKEDLEQ